MFIGLVPYGVTVKDWLDPFLWSLSVFQFKHDSGLFLSFFLCLFHMHVGMHLLWVPPEAGLTAGSEVRLAIGAGN